MMIRRSSLILTTLLALSASAVGPLGARAQTLVESSLEARFQLDLAVPQAALDELIPSGWSMNVAAQGPAKDANLRVIFIERLTINDADGDPAGDGSNILVYLTAPVTDPTGANVQLVVGGITADPADAPGPFGVYLPAATNSLRRATTTGAGPIVETQQWVLRASSGEHFEMDITFERGVSSRRPARETRFYSAGDPTVYEISRQQQVLDILRNVTTNPPDRVRDFSFSGGGGRYAALFDGSERLLSWDNIVWLDREVLRP